MWHSALVLVCSVASGHIAIQKKCSVNVFCLFHGGADARLVFELRIIHLDNSQVSCAIPHST